MEQIISKEIAEKLMKVKGELRGAVFKTDIQFILKEKGKEGLKKIEKEMERLGYPFEYEKIRVTSFYPIGLRAVSLLVMKKVLGFSNEKITEMGFEAPRSSFILRLSMKFLAFTRSAKLWYQNTPGLWRKFVTIGEFSVPEFDEKDKKIVIDRIRDFNVHPILCTYLLGILPSFNELARGLSGLTCKETKCSFQGGKYHEFLVKW